MTSKAPLGRRGSTARLSPWTSRSSSSATRSGRSEAARTRTRMTLCPRPDVAGCMSVESLSVHARRRLIALALLSLIGAALIVVLDRRHARSQNALGPSVVGGVEAAKPFAYDPDRRADYER